MKKQATRVFSFFIVFTMTILETIFFCPAISAADDVNSFQQEIILSRQKQQQLSGKIQSIHLALEAEKNKQMQSEADALMAELAGQEISKSIPASSPEVKMSVPMVPNPAKPEEKPNAQKPKPLEKWMPWLYRSSKTNVISDGESLYKVAVSDNKITIREAIDIGLANNTQIRANEKKIEVAEAKLLEAKRARFPTVSAVVENNGGIAAERFYKGRNYKLNVTQPLFYGGELMLTVKQAEESVKSAREELRKSKNDFIHTVRTAFYNVVKSEYNVQYQASLYEEVSGVYKQLKEQYGQKIASEVDYLSTESRYLQIFFQAESAKNDLLSAQLILHQTIEVPSDEPLPVELKLTFNKVDAKFDEIFDKAVKENPDVQVKEHAVLSAKYNLDVYRAKKYPRVDLRGSYGMLGEVHKDDTAILAGKADLDLEKEWFVGLQTSMPIGANSVDYNITKHVYGPTVIALTGSEDYSHKVTFNLLDKFSDMTDEKQAQATYLQAQNDYEKAKSDLTVNLRDNFYNLQKSLIQIDSSIAKVRYQEKQNEVLRYMLHLQESGVSDFLDGLIEQAQNRFSFIQAVTDYHLAISNLNLSLGDPFYFED